MACRVLILIIIIHLGNMKTFITFLKYIFDMTHFKTFYVNYILHIEINVTCKSIIYYKL